MKTMILAIVLAVALMLAGCGGGGSRIASTPTPNPTPTPEPTLEPVTGLPSGHMLASGTIPAGEIRTILEADGMRTTVTCPAGGAACMITVASDGTATFTGGRPTVATALIPVSSADWLREPAWGWDRRTGPYSYDPTSNIREFRERRDGYEIYSWWGELQSSNGFLGYYGMQSRPGGSIQAWFERHADTFPPNAFATWRGSFLGYAFRRQFADTDEGWTQANDIEARFADTETLTVSGTEVPYATKLTGTVQMSVSYSPGSPTLNWELSNSRSLTGDPFGPVRLGSALILTLTNLDRSHSPFTVERDGTFSSSQPLPYTTRAEALAGQLGSTTPAEPFEISGAFVGTGGHGVLGTINSRGIWFSQVPGSSPTAYMIQSYGVRGAFGAIRE